MTYQTLLDREYSRRCRLNGAYSLRAFARDLGIQPSQLSEIFKGKKGLSSTKAAEICRRLKWSGLESEEFVSLVDREHARNPLNRTQAAKKLHSLKASQAFGEMSMQDFRKVSTWVALAILELVELMGPRQTKSQMATRLGVPQCEIQEALEGLLSVGYLRKVKNGLQVTEKNQATPKVVSSRAIRDFHHSVLQRARQKLETVDPERREFSSLIFAIDPSRMQEAKKWLSEFRREFSTDMESKGPSSQIYCLSTQFFPIENNDDPPNTETES